MIESINFRNAESAEAHTTLREAAGQFYIINGAALAIPSLLELIVSCRPGVLWNSYV